MTRKNHITSTLCTLLYTSFFGLSLLFALTCGTGCTDGGRTGGETEACADTTVTEIRYARNFTLEQLTPHVRILTIRNAESAHAEEFRYALYDDDTPPQDIPADCTPVHIPVQNFICMTSLQLSNFIALGLTDHVTGITSTRHLFSPEMKQQLANGKTAQIGIEGNFDNEVIIALDPDLILYSPSKRGGFDVLAETGLPMMPHLGYQEPLPLGQAEWIKLVGILTGHEKEAAEQFDSIASHYEDLCRMVTERTDSTQWPTIMSGDTKGGAWYATGGNSFLARIFRDAGSRYFMQDDKSTGGVNIDYETVYAQGADADYWRISNSFDGDFTYEALAQQDSRFADFRAYRQKHVIYCNMSQHPFYESFPVHPDLLLEDFIAVFHPDLLPNHRPSYYNLLK